MRKARLTYVDKTLKDMPENPAWPEHTIWTGCWLRYLRRWLQRLLPKFRWICAPPIPNSEAGKNPADKPGHPLSPRSLKTGMRIHADGTE